MTTTQMVQIMLQSLALKKIKLQVRLEEAIKNNSQDNFQVNIDMQLMDVESIISEMVLTDLKIAKINSMTQVVDTPKTQD